MRRKAESQSRKTHTASVMVEGKRKSQKPPNKPSLLQESEEIDSENTASAYETDSNSDDSTSESTITDSSPEDGSNSAFVQQVQPTKMARGKKPKPGFRRTSEEALDLFISAAEALNNIVPPEVALHDHSYALPPSSIINNVELQGTSGLSLIAAAAAVVSPTLSKSAASTKLPSLSPVRAPRGRPPNSQRKGTNGTTSKLAPSMLSPAGTSPSVLLTEMKAAPLRGRARSAPSDRPKVSTLHVSRAGSTLARMSINSSSRTVNRGTGLMSSSSYSRHKGESSAGKGASSLKSMIAFHPPSSSSNTPSSTANSTASTNSSSAFEALVNVAVAAPPAELPHSAISGASPSPHTNSHPKSSSPSTTTTAFTATPLSRSQPTSKDTVTIGVAGANSNASNSTTTAYIDVNQAINILASLAQQQVSSSAAANGSSQSIVLPNSRLFTQNSVNLLGNIVSQGTKAGNAGLMSATSKGAKGLSVSATVDTLLGHLTSGMGAQTPSSKNVAPGKTIVGGSVPKVKSAKSDASGSKVATTFSGTKLASNTSLATGVPQSIQLMGNMDDLSNLNLLSSLVAAVAASQATPTTSQQTTPSSEATLASNFKTSVGQPSNLYSSSKTEVKRPLESIVSALAAVSRNSSSSSLTESASNSSSHSQSHTPTPSEDGNGKAREHVDRLIAPSSSIKKASMQSSSSVGTVYGAMSSSTNELPRSVVRTGLGTMAAEESLTSQGNSNVAPSESDMTASLASIIPPYNPSMSSQSSLLLYTRSLSFPLSVAPEPSAEEEDHLESATRGISELSKLLGTDTEHNSSPNTKHDCSVYKGLSNWNPADLLTSSKNACNDFSVLESQIHGTVHHASLASPKLNSSATNSGRSENMEATLDVDHSR